jgi:hypothetical protein
MYDSYRDVRRRAVLPGETWTHGREMIERHGLDHLVVGPPGEHEPMLEMLREDQPASRPPCGGRCERFGVQGCHSPRCLAGR